MIFTQEKDESLRKKKSLPAESFTIKYHILSLINKFLVFSGAKDFTVRYTLISLIRDKDAQPSH